MSARKRATPSHQVDSKSDRSGCLRWAREGDSPERIADKAAGELKITPAHLSSALPFEKPPLLGCQ